MSRHRERLIQRSISRIDAASRALRGDVDYNGRTALHLAAAEGKDDALHLLLALGADPRKIDCFGSTAIEEARRGGHRSAVALLSAHLATAT